ncbi:hypothetical protein [Comamonas odontotermitis]|uniref:hypothetical protein n=1 Tax=Comamonas odontotermitis TaxID=379895 RepID=UPI001CC33D8A|nr:hypothetical protein [Comamonas odontotermitis]UBB18371.1 hypothetical protein LAD35_06960 [Comamonas odontotermitis]
MAGVDGEISREALEIVSTESFAQNVASHRSLLLKWEKEVKESRPNSKRALTIYKDAFLLQGVIEQQIADAGDNARQLGVPPEALQDNLRIYKRVMVLVALKIGAELDLNSPQAERVLQVAGDDGASEEVKGLASNIKMARLSLDKITTAPQVIDLIGGAFLQLAQQIQGQLDVYGGLSAFSGTEAKAPSFDAAPPVPPGVPPRPSGGGDSGGDLPRRVDKLEEKVDKLNEGIGDLKVQLGRMEERLMHLTTKSDVAAELGPVKVSISKIDERLTHVPTKFDLVKAAIAIPGATWLVTKYGDPLLNAMLSFFK